MTLISRKLKYNFKPPILIFEDVFSEPFFTFEDKDKNKITWYKRDRYNESGQHNLHVEYEEVEVIKRALLYPLFICKDKEHAKRLCYYGYETEIAMMKVVVQFSSKNKGVLITTFRVDEIHPAEQIIWQQEK